MAWNLNPSSSPQCHPASDVYTSRSEVAGQGFDDADGMSATSLPQSSTSRVPGLGGKQCPVPSRVVLRPSSGKPDYVGVFVAPREDSDQSRIMASRSSASACWITLDESSL